MKFNATVMNFLNKIGIDEVPEQLKNVLSNDVRFDIKADFK